MMILFPSNCIKQRITRSSPAPLLLHLFQMSTSKYFHCTKVHNSFSVMHLLPSHQNNLSQFQSYCGSPTTKSFSKPTVLGSHPFLTFAPSHTLPLTNPQATQVSLFISRSSALPLSGRNISFNAPLALNSHFPEPQEGVMDYRLQAAAKSSN